MSEHGRPRLLWFVEVVKMVEDWRSYGQHMHRSRKDLIIERTPNHLFDSFLVILAEINDPTVRLGERITASTIEEAAPGADNCSVDRPLTVVACDRQVAVLPTNVKTATSVSAPHC